LYFPLPKIHSSHQQIQIPKIIEETTKKPISDEFIPSSVIEQEEIESNIYIFFLFFENPERNMINWFPSGKPREKEIFFFQGERELSQKSSILFLAYG
jgi:hypothetical protein